jgi:hypothetical protein
MAYIIHITSSTRLPKLLARIKAEHQASAVASAACSMRWLQADRGEAAGWTWQLAAVV